ncbi:MAG: hypothetical protein N4A36_00350 [Candidatus Gracilibacteria bacterium]|jgi:hypothetical protein|nr:hypothetical protein [Candidatus Gracilibacteria bacterium]
MERLYEKTRTVLEDYQSKPAEAKQFGSIMGEVSRGVDTVNLRGILRSRQNDVLLKTLNIRERITRFLDDAIQDGGFRLIFNKNTAMVAAMAGLVLAVGVLNQSDMKDKMEQVNVGIADGDMEPSGRHDIQPAEVMGLGMAGLSYDGNQSEIGQAFNEDLANLISENPKLVEWLVGQGVKIDVR